MFDRLGSILRSYIDNENAHTHGRANATKTSGAKKQFNSASTAYENAQSRATKNHTNNARESSMHQIIPRELMSDFIRLGLTSSASLELCKKNHKRLMVKYHPDKHVGNPFALIQAHEMSARINMSFQRITQWFSTGIVD